MCPSVNRVYAETRALLTIDQQSVTNDLDLREGVTRVIGDRLRAPPPSGSNVDYVETVFVASIIQTTLRVVLPQKRRKSRRAWGGRCNGVTVRDR